MRVRKLAHRLSYRFRLHRKDLPGSPDLVFASRRKVVFVNGCFWHGHNEALSATVSALVFVNGCFWHGHNCARGSREPKTNFDYWRNKIQRNRKRDNEAHVALSAAGWDVLVLWECELRDEAGLSERLVRFLNATAYVCACDAPARWG